MREYLEEITENLDEVLTVLDHLDAGQTFDPGILDKLKSVILNAGTTPSTRKTEGPFQTAFKTDTYTLNLYIPTPTLASNDSMFLEIGSQGGRIHRLKLNTSTLLDSQNYGFNPKLTYETKSTVPLNEFRDFVLAKVPTSQRIERGSLPAESLSAYQEVLSGRLPINEILERLSRSVARCMEYDVKADNPTIAHSYTPSGEEIFKGFDRDAGAVIRKLLGQITIEGAPDLIYKEPINSTQDTTTVFDSKTGRWVVLNSKSQRPNRQDTLIPITSFANYGLRLIP